MVSLHLSRNDYGEVEYDKCEMKKCEPANGKFGRGASQSCVAKNFRELDQIAFLP